MKKSILIFAIEVFVYCTFLTDNCNAQGWTNIGSGMNQTVTALTVFNNELIAGGYFTTADGVSANRIAKWNGTNWVPLGSGMDGAVQQLVVFNNELIAGGQFLNAGGVSAKHIAKWDGTNWAPLGSGMDSSVYVLGVYNGELIAGGNFITAGGVSANRMAKWNGTSWSPLGSGISSSPPYKPGVYSLTIFNNELVVSGEFTIAGGVPVNHIAKWNGTNWSAFTTGVVFHISCIGVYNNEFIGNNVLGYYMAKWTGTNWSPLGNEITGHVKDFTTYNNELIAGGVFYYSGIDTFRNIAKWNGTIWSSLGSGLSSDAYGLTVYNNDLIVGGDFTTAGGVSANKIAKWRPTFPVSGSVLYSDNSQPATNGYVKAVKLEKATGNIITFDSAQIQTNGTYTLAHVPRDSVVLVFCPNSPGTSDWVVSYYPSTIYWRNASTLYPAANMTGVNIGVTRITSSTNSNSVNGKVMGLNNSQSVNIKDAVLYAKSGNTFVRCGMSDAAGVYHLSSLPAGSLKILVDRFGYSGDSTNVTVTSMSNTDSVNFHLYRTIVNIKQVETTVPTEYRLYQNYPNPFNPETRIRYSLPRSSFVNLVVYDALGREVQNLVNESQREGTYEAEFNASDIPSGVYFYRLTAEGYSETRKMVLLK